MSYCRNNGDDSEVYMYGSSEALECCGCRLNVDPPEKLSRKIQQRIVRWIMQWIGLVESLIGILSGGFYTPNIALMIMLGGHRNKILNWLNPPYRRNPDPRFTEYSKALAHLGDHINAGHKVPDYAIDRLKEEMVETDNRYGFCKHGVDWREGYDANEGLDGCPECNSENEMRRVAFAIGGLLDQEHAMDVRHKRGALRLSIDWLQMDDED